MAILCKIVGLVSEILHAKVKECLQSTDSYEALVNYRLPLWSNLGKLTSYFEFTFGTPKQLGYCTNIKFDKYPKVLFFQSLEVVLSYQTYSYYKKKHNDIAIAW